MNPNTSQQPAPETQTVTTPEGTITMTELPDQPSGKDLLSIQIIGYVLLISSIAIITVVLLTFGKSFPPPAGNHTFLTLPLSVLTAIAAIGLLARKKIAYTATNILSVLNILATLPVLLFIFIGLPMLLSLGAGLGVFEFALTIVGMVAKVLLFITSIYLLIRLHPKSVRAHFR